MSYKGGKEECLTRMSRKNCLTRVSSKKCLTRVSHKSVKQECLTRALRNSVKQGCPTRVPLQCVKSGCLTSEFVGNVTNKYCLCLSTYVLAFGFVGFILFFSRSCLAVHETSSVKRENYQREAINMNLGEARR